MAYSWRSLPDMELWPGSLPATLLPVATGCGRDLKDLVRGQRSVRQLFGGCIDGIAGAHGHRFFCNHHDRDTRRYRNRLRTVLISNHQSAAVALLYRAVRHAGVGNGGCRDGGVCHSSMSSCAWRIPQNTNPRPTPPIPREDDGLLLEVSAACPL